jgi:hypothetical protein
MAHRVFDLLRADYQSVYAQPFIADSGYRQRSPECPACHEFDTELISPVVIQWEPGSDLVADFTWPVGLGEIIVTQRVRDYLDESTVTSVTFRPVEMTEDPKAKRSSRKRRRAEPQVQLPYEGPPLWHLQVTSEAKLDLKASQRTLFQKCAACGREIWDAPRRAPQVVMRSSWDGAEFFRIREVGEVIFVVERVRDLLQSRDFTNVRLTERGRIE